MLGFAATILIAALQAGTPAAPPCAQAGDRIASGRQLLSSGKVKDAEAAFDAAEQLCPYPNIVLDAMHAETAARERELAARRARAYLKTNPAADPVAEELARVLVDSHRAAEALPIVDRLLRRNPNEVSLLLLAGHAAMQAGKPGKAIEVLSRARKLSGDAAEALFLLANAYRLNGQFPRAISVFEELLRRDPSGYGAYNGMALCYDSLGQTDSAIRYFRRAEETSAASAPHWSAGSENLAELLLKLDRTDESIQAARRAVSRDPNSPRAEYLLGAALNRAGKNTEAVGPLQKAVQIDPHDYRAHYLLSRVYFALHRSSDGEREAAAARAAQRYNDLRSRTETSVRPAASSQQK